VGFCSQVCYTTLCNVAMLSFYRFDHQNNARVNRRMITNVIAVCKKAKPSKEGDHEFNDIVSFL